MTASAEKDPVRIKWLRKMEGQPLFASLPPQVVLDKRITPGVLRIYSALLLHAGPDGRTRGVSNERLAELLGHSDTQQIKRALASGTRGGKGGTLIQLGYVKNLGQVGLNQANAYQFCIPESGEYNEAKSRRMPDAKYKLHKAIEREAVERGECAKDKWENPVDGSLWLLVDVQRDLAYVNRTGEAPDAPKEAYAHFGIEYPEQVWPDFPPIPDEFDCDREDAPDAGDLPTD